MEKRKIKFTEDMVCFQEVPDEVSLSFSISNCPRHCPGCHSQYLAQDIGWVVEDFLDERIQRYRDLITCVLFMGGDDPEQIDNLIQCATHCKEQGLKIALYSGGENVPPVLWQLFDYIKIGPYIKAKGGLEQRSTNQQMYQKTPEGWTNITYKFWTKGLKV